MVFLGPNVGISMQTYNELEVSYGSAEIQTQDQDGRVVKGVNYLPSNKQTIFYGITCPAHVESTNIGQIIVAHE